MTSGRPAFRQHAKHAGVVIPPSSRTRGKALSTGHTSHNSDRRKRITQPGGAATPRNSDAHKRVAVPQALCVLREHPRPRPKSGKVCRSDTRPGDVRERAVRVEGNDSAPSEMPPVSACEPLCALAGAKTDNDSAPGDFEQLLADFRCTEIGAGERHWRFSAPMPIHSSPQCELPQGFAGFEN